jgi:hypothetical protein
MQALLCLLRGASFWVKHPKSKTNLALLTIKAVDVSGSPVAAHH